MLMTDLTHSSTVTLPSLKYLHRLYHLLWLRHPRLLLWLLILLPYDLAQITLRNGEFRRFNDLLLQILFLKFLKTSELVRRGTRKGAKAVFKLCLLLLFCRGRELLLQLLLLIVHRSLRLSLFTLSYRLLGGLNLILWEILVKALFIKTRWLVGYLRVGLLD